MTLFHISYWPALGSISSPCTMVLIGDISCNLPTKMNQYLTSSFQQQPSSNSFNPED